MHDSALDFLVIIIARIENTAESVKLPSSHGGGPEFQSPLEIVFLQSDTPETSIRAFSDTKIMEKNKYNKDKKL